MTAAAFVIMLYALPFGLLVSGAPKLEPEYRLAYSTSENHASPTGMTLSDFHRDSSVSSQNVAPVSAAEEPNVYGMSTPAYEYLMESQVQSPNFIQATATKAMRLSDFRRR